MNIIGIDPGANGAKVQLFIDGDTIVAAIHWSLAKEGKISRDWVESIHKEEIPKVFIEKIPKFVAGNDKIPLSAMCTLYGSYKYQVGVYEALYGCEHVTEVIPQRWQRTVCGRLPKMSYADRKKWLCLFAKKTAEGLGIHIKITLTNCDAFLIAYYGYLSLKKKND
jgi:hypothetical protein